MGENVAVWDGVRWTSIRGDRGEPGKALAIRGVKATVADLPTTGVEGDLWIVSATGDGYTFDPHATPPAYVNVGRIQGPPGPQGTKGDKGDKGDSGNNGAGATVRVGRVTTGAAGSTATISNSGTATAAVLDFSIPQGTAGAKGDKGDQGAASTIAVGVVTDLPSGTPATVTNVGTASAAILNFGIPAGQQGTKGDTGTAGAAGATGAAGRDGVSPTVSIGTVTTGSPGSSATVTDSGTSPNHVFNFSIPTGVTGATGPAGKDAVNPAFTIGTVTAAASPSVTIGGTAPNYTLSFGLVKGDTGPAGPAGKDGAGVTIKGTADGGTWPPTGTHTAGDLWIIGTPIPTGVPAGAATGHGMMYDGTNWKDVGPIQGPSGPAGVAGPAGPSAVSTDAGNAARLGADSLIYVPTVTPPRAGSTAPLALAATAAVGSSTDYARNDHVHPFPTAAQVGAAATTHTHAAAQVTGLATVAVSGEYADLKNAPAAYTLPTASATVLGGVKIGTGITIDTNGVISATGGGGTGTVADATTTTKGIVQLAAAADITGTGSTTSVVTGSQLVAKTKDLAPLSSPAFVGHVTVPASVTPASPSLRFTGDDDTGLYSPASGAVAIAVNGVNGLEVGGTGTVVRGVLTAGGNKFPSTMGTSGQHLSTDGAGTLTWVDAAAVPVATDKAAGIVKVGSGLSATADGTLSVTWTTASTTQQGVVSLADAAAVTAGTAGRVIDAATFKANIANYVPLAGGVMTGQLSTPTLIATSAIQVAGSWFPTTKGTAGQVLQTNGTGTLSWADVKAPTLSATDRLLGRSSAGAGPAEEIPCTPYIRTLLDDADAATARATLSVQPTNNPAHTGTATFTGPVLIHAGSGTAGNFKPGLAIIGDDDTGVQQVGGANTLSVVTGGNERIRATDGRVFINGNGEQFGLGVRYSSTGGAVHFGATSNSAAPDAAISNAGGGTLMTLKNDGTATFAGQVLVTAGSGSSGSYKPGIAIFGDDNTGIMQQAGADTLTFVTAGREAITIDAIQQVKFKQQIQASSQQAAGIPMYAFDGDPDTGIGRVGQDILTLITAGSQRVQVSAAGNVSIGTSSDNGNKLQVAGQIWATSGTIVTSDAKFKENVQPLTDATSVVERLRPVAFDFIPQPDREFSTDRQVGLIAQEAQAALAGTDYADSVVSQCGDHLGLSYEKLVPVLIRALQESNARIAALEEKLRHA